MLFILNYFEIDFFSNNIQIITYTKLFDIKDPLPLVVALHMTTPAAEEIVTLLLELGADLSLSYQDGDSKTIFDAIMNESIRFTETISGEKLTNGSLLDKLIMEHNLESLNSIRKEIHNQSNIFFVGWIPLTKKTPPPPSLLGSYFFI